MRQCTPCNCMPQSTDMYRSHSCMLCGFLVWCCQLKAQAWRPLHECTVACAADMR